MKPSAVTTVPIASSPRSPNRSASRPGRHLGGGERARIAGLEDAGRRERQAELRLPDRQQDEDHVREAVVQEMGRAGGREHGPPPAPLVVLDYGPGSGEHGADLRL